MLAGHNLIPSKILLPLHYFQQIISYKFNEIINEIFPVLYPINSNISTSLTEVDKVLLQCQSRYVKEINNLKISAKYDKLLNI